MERMWHYPLSLLHAVGLYTDKPTKKVIIATSVYTFVFSFIVTVLAVQLVNVRNDISAFVTNVEGISAFSQPLFKGFLIGWNQRKLIAILNNAKQFWKTAICPDDLKLELDTTACMFTRMLKLFLFTGLLSVVGVDVVALITNSLPSGTWVLENKSLLYYLTLACQLTFFPLGLIALCLDCLFLALCFETALQFRILCHFIKNLSYSANSELLNENDALDWKLCIQHHDFLLKFMNSLEDYISLGLLGEYLCISPLIFAEMYITLESYSLQLTAIHGIAFCLAVSQFGLYCFALDVVATEAEAVAFSVYDSKWYTEYVPARRRCANIMMARGQKRIVFTAGGLIEINMPALLHVIRVSWSIYNLSKVMKG